MLVSRAGLSPVMVGRDSELAQLRRLAATATGPTIALIGGEPGIGKTRLATELIRAQPEATTKLLGQTDASGFGQPYQLLLDLAGDRPELAEPVRDRSLDSMERNRAAIELLRALVGAGPALLVVDDIHWADPESLAIFEQLDEVTSEPLLLVGTYRPEELSRRHPLAEVLGRLDRRRGVTHLRLERLAPADTARFLAAVYGRPPARRTVAALHQRTGGNPFFLEELLKAAGDTDLDKIHLQPLPWNLAEALRSQLDGLAPDRRQVVEAAAVLGGRVPFDLLATVTGQAEPELIAALRELVDRGLLVEAEEDQFGFRHALTREAVAGELLSRQRRRLHEAALEALLATPDPDPARVAKHARGAGRFDDMVAAARRGAIERLASGAPYAALTIAEQALEEVPDDPELLGLAATAAWRAGYLSDAQRYGQRALRAATGDAQRVAALTHLMRVAWEQGELAEMDEYTERLRALTETLPDNQVRTRAIAAVAQAYMLRSGGPNGLDDAVAWAERAYAAAERHGLKEVRLAALVEKGSALLQGPDTAAEGQRLLAEVAAEAEHAGAHLEATRSLHNLFWFAGEHATPEVLERMRSNAKRGGFTGMALGAYYGGRAWLAQRDGDLDGAIAVLEAARRLDRNMIAIDPAGDGPIALHLGLSSGAHLAGALAQLYLERGDLDAAEELIAELPASRKARSTGIRLAFQLACRRGDLATAQELLPDLTGGSGHGASLHRDGAMLHNLLAAGFAAGLPVELLRPLADSVAAAAGKGKHEALWPLITGQLAEAVGDHQAALAAYQQLPDQPTAIMTEAQLGTASVGAARCLVQLGRLDEAREALADAERRLARWSGWRRAELNTIARRLGVAAGAADTVLTPREREVAALLADGLTNSEIARRLVISRKTVAVHVSHILGKLEMSSRAQVAAWVAREQPLARSSSS
ncbi:MAG TPA: LuxR C-terminal-related transcriptional regulator [Natronosporangium sp.]